MGITYLISDFTLDLFKVKWLGQRSSFHKKSYISKSLSLSGNATSKVLGLVHHISSSSLLPLSNSLSTSNPGSASLHWQSSVQGCSFTKQQQSSLQECGSQPHTKSFNNSGGAQGCVIIFGCMSWDIWSLYHPHPLRHRIICMPIRACFHSESWCVTLSIFCVKLFLVGGSFFRLYCELCHITVHLMTGNLSFHTKHIQTALMQQFHLLLGVQFPMWTCIASYHLIWSWHWMLSTSYDQQSSWLCHSLR